MAIWDNLRFPRVATDAILPPVLEGSPFFVRSRKRVTVNDGTAHQDLAYRYDFLTGEIREFAYKKIITPSEATPFLAIWDSDHDIDVSHWPLLVPELRAQCLEVMGSSALVTSWSGTVSGSVFTGPAAGTNAGDAFTNLIAALLEEVAVHGGYTNWRCVNIGGTDYSVTNVNSVSRSITVSGTPPTGTQTLIVYHHRIAGSTTTARVFKDSGRATMTPDGVAIIAGLRRRDRFQGHSHGSLIPTSAVAQYTGAGGGFIGPSGAIVVPSSDGTNGTPRTGDKTEPNSTGVYRYIYGGQYVA